MLSHLVTSSRHLSYNHEGRNILIRSRDRTPSPNLLCSIVPSPTSPFHNLAISPPRHLTTSQLSPSGPYAFISLRASVCEMSQSLIHANEHENAMHVEGHKSWWPRDENKRKDAHPEHNPPLDVSLGTLRSQGDTNETAIRGILAARACTVDEFQEFMRSCDRIWLMGFIVDGLQALPKSNERYVART